MILDIISCGNTGKIASNPLFHTTIFLVISIIWLNGKIYDSISNSGGRSHLGKTIPVSIIRGHAIADAIPLAPLALLANIDIIKLIPIVDSSPNISNGINNRYA